MTPLTSHGASPSGLHVRYEKAGLILDSLPIPSNADAVIVEAIVRLPPKAPREKHFFTLQWAADENRIPAELLLNSRSKGPTRVLFRVAVPGANRNAVIRWRDHLLGEVNVPIIDPAEFIRGVSLDSPMVSVCFGADAIACRSFVSSQIKAIIASASLRSTTPLASLIDWGLGVKVSHDNRGKGGDVKIALTDDQLRQKSTLVSAVLPKPSQVGEYEVSWTLADRCLHKQKIRSVSKRAFLSSLRVSATRFDIRMKDGSRHVVRALPGDGKNVALNGIQSVSPVFYLASTITGIAGYAPLTLCARVEDELVRIAEVETALFTEGLRAITPGTVPLVDLPRVKYFSLACGDRVLGNLPLTTAPTADFTGEGGFVPLDDFLWSPSAEAELNDRLGKLLDGV